MICFEHVHHVHENLHKVPYTFDALQLLLSKTLTFKIQVAQASSSAHAARHKTIGPVTLTQAPWATFKPPPSFLEFCIKPHPAFHSHHYLQNRHHIWRVCQSSLWTEDSNPPPTRAQHCRCIVSFLILQTKSLRSVSRQTYSSIKLIYMSMHDVRQWKIYSSHPSQWEYSERTGAGERWTSRDADQELGIVPGVIPAAQFLKRFIYSLDRRLVIMKRWSLSRILYIRSRSRIDKINLDLERAFFSLKPLRPFLAPPPANDPLTMDIPLSGNVTGAPQIPSVPHDILVKQKQGQSILIWAVGALVLVLQELFHSS